MPPAPVHPHVCGKHICKMSFSHSVTDSSPRMWETQFLLLFIHGVDRFIPTYVGNTVAATSDLPTPPIHPHVCGKHLFGSLTVPFHRDSSPRMWETRCGSRSCHHGHRFIPTYVGNTLNEIINNFSVLQNFEKVTEPFSNTCPKSRRTPFPARRRRIPDGRPCPNPRRRPAPSR